MIIPRTLLTTLGCISLLTTALHAQVPNLLNYQGRVAVGTTNFNGAGSFKFALVNAAGSTVYWGNAADTSPADGVPDTAVALTVTKGLYSVLLGDTSVANMAAVPASVWTNADVRLRVWFNDGTTGFQLLTPDQRLAPNGYVADGSVSSAALANGAVTSAKLASGSVTSTQLASGLTLSGTTIGTFSGILNGNATGNAATVTTNANLTGPITSVGNATSVASQTGTGSTFVMATSPILVTPTLGAAAATSLALPTTTGATVGVIRQNGSPLIHTYGTDNFFAGQSAGNFTMTGANNTASGDSALLSNTTGGYNAASGALALYSNTTGFNNTASGANALFGNTTGGFNTASGTNALLLNTTGVYNTASGADALRTNTTGVSNAASGAYALYTNTTGLNNTASGTSALYSNTTGSNNIALGREAGLSLTTGDNNIVIGHPGVAGQSNIIRIGTSQAATYLTGIIYGNGSGLTGLPTSALTGSITGAQLASGLTLGGSTTGTFSGTFSGNGAALTNLGGANITLGSIPLGALAANSVDSSNIVNGTIVANDLASNAVTSAKISNTAVTTAKLNDAAVTKAKLDLFAGGGPPINSLDGGPGVSLVLYPGSSTPGSEYPPHGFGIEGNTLYSVVPQGNRFVWYGGTSEVMRLTSEGNLGIGTTSPGHRLEINGTSQMGSLEVRWPGSTPFIDFSDNATDDYSARIILTRSGGVPALNIAGAELYCYAINLTSDRNAKEQFKPVNARAVLDKVARLPITEWQYKATVDQSPNAARHIGPMAQDFREAFALGHDEKHITSVDADGVALAAIQGLHEIVQEKEAELARLKTENRALAERLTAIERALGMQRKANASSQEN